LHKFPTLNALLHILTMFYSHLQGVSLRRVQNNRSRCMCSVTICRIYHSIRLEHISTLQGVGIQQILRRVRKIAKSNCQLRHVCVSVSTSAWNNSAPTGRIFIKFCIWGFSENLSRKFKFLLSLTRITGTLHEYLCTFMIICSWIILILRNVSDKFVEKN
jgi:hypothetical protein